MKARTTAILQVLHCFVSKLPGCSCSTILALEKAIEDGILQHIASYLHGAYRSKIQKPQAGQIVALPIRLGARKFASVPGSVVEDGSKQTSA